MKRLGITQRVEYVRDRGEVRDCLDQRWSVLALELGFEPMPLPTSAPQHVPALLDAFGLDGVILSGGNSLTRLDPGADDAAPGRDAFEAALIDEAVNRDLPIVGVCRGMQMINAHLGGQLTAVAGHAGTRHPVKAAARYSGLIADSVNSYHAWGLREDQLAVGLDRIATDAENHVEGFVHAGKRIAGVMWHPERESPFRPEDLALLAELLK